MMKKNLLAVVAVVATPLVAQTMPMPMSAPGVQRPMMRGAMGDKVQTRADVLARVQRGFAMLDANHDGALDQAELAAAAKLWDAAQGQMKGAGGMMHMPMDRNAMFDMIDTDHNGAISRDEFARAPMPHDGMGKATVGMGMGKGMNGGMARMWSMADTNHDGKVTQAEANAVALQSFDKMDANHDGKLTADERVAARGMMHAGQ
ncbi:MAG: EF-hand domain-containing protein [Sphingomicrobium sp.]